MKIQIIATLLAATAFGLFPAMKPEAVDSLTPASAESAEESESTWRVTSSDKEGIELFQETGEKRKDDPLAPQSEGGFAAGGVIELVEDPKKRQDIIDLGSGEAMVIDTVAPVRASSSDNVNQVRVSPAEAVIAAVEEKMEEGKTAVEETIQVESAREPAAEGSEGDDAKEPESTPDLAEASLDSGDEAAMEEDESPRSPLPSVASTVAEDESREGLADRLLDRVTEAVGVADRGNEEDGEENAAPTMGEEDDGGFWLRGARLNDVFQYLARLGHKQYFHNADLEASNYLVTGHLGDGDPIEQMGELGLMYAVTIHEKGQTVYAMTEAQLAQLPTQPLFYRLKYLRPSDIDQIRAILQPVLTPGSGSVDFEQKTNTLIFIDNEQRLERVLAVLAELDQPKRQIAIETRILRVRSTSRNRIGVDWESVLGEGLTFSGSEALNTLFNLPDSDLVEQVITTSLGATATSPFTIANVNKKGKGTLLNGDITGERTLDSTDVTERTINSTESQLVLSPLQLQATLRALNTGGLAHQESSPTLITEDNEAAIISIIDRIPIIISTVSATTVGQNTTDQVRYLIDPNDPSFSDDPAANREIGVTVAVTPTILPDGTIRMALRPRTAQVVEFVESVSGNKYPRVSESTIDTIARVPNGYSLLIGGFYEEQESEIEKKVPVLGDIPGLNFFFKSSDTQKDQTSLVFVVTPRLYDPVMIQEVDQINQEIHERHVLSNDHAWPDRRSPGSNYEPNLGWTLGNAINAYPPTPPTSPLHPEHPVNLPEWDIQGEQGIQAGETMVEPVSDRRSARRRRPGGLFGSLFKNRRR